MVQGQQAQFHAAGVAAVRLSPDGKLEAMAVGGLQSFKASDVTTSFPAASTRGSGATRMAGGVGFSRALTARLPSHWQGSPKCGRV